MPRHFRRSRYPASLGARARRPGQKARPSSTNLGPLESGLAGARLRPCTRRLGAGPADCGTIALALGVLRSAACFATSDLLTLHLAGVAGDESGVAQLFAQGLIVFHERTGNSVTDGAGLTGDATAVDLHREIKPGRQLHRLEGLTDDHPTRLATEELIEGAIVHRDLAGAGLHVHPRRCSFAAAGAVVRLLSGHLVFGPYLISSGLGCCAWCGCSV